MRPPSGEGFTLLELLVVLVILGLLAGVVAVRLQVPYRQARLGEVLQRIAFIDQQVRIRARHSARSIHLVCDFDKNAIYAESDADGDVPHLRYAIPQAVRLDQVRLPGKVSDTGRVAIFVAPDGRTRSYAIRLNVIEQTGQFMFFAGMTGQIRLWEAEADVEKLFAALTEGRTDAD